MSRTDVGIEANQWPRGFVNREGLINVDTTSIDVVKDDNYRGPRDDKKDWTKVHVQRPSAVNLI